MRNANHAQGGALPGLARVDLGYGDVEVGPQPVLHAAHHLPLVFERVRAFNADLEREIRNHSPSYCASSRTPWVLSCENSVPGRRWSLGTASSNCFLST